MTSLNIGNEPPDFLVVILDLNQLSWSEIESDLSSSGHRDGVKNSGKVRNQGAEDDDDDDDEDGCSRISLDSLIKSFLIFSNAHLGLNDENSIAIYGVTISSCELLYTSIRSNDHSSRFRDRTISTKSSSSSSDPNTHPTFRVLDQSIYNGIKRLISSDHNHSLNHNNQNSSILKKNVGLVKALSKSLCYINRITKSKSSSNQDTSTASSSSNKASQASSSLSTNNSKNSRILILSVSPDYPNQYIPIMNCIFSAQKAGIPIDVCKVDGEDAIFMQQASHLTEGIYYKIERPKALIQYLMMIFLPGIQARKLLNLPQQDRVDLRSTCFCHRKIIDIGYVCSVCLSIFCSPIPVCFTCKTKFPISSLKRFVQQINKPNNNGKRKLK